MPYSNNHTLNFISGDYKLSKPKYALKDMIYPGNMKFATKTRKLDLSTEDYGYVTMEVSYTGSMDFVAIVFYDDNGEDVSIRDSLNGLFYVSNKTSFLENVILGKDISGTKTFYVVVNTNQLNTNRFLTIEVAVGAYNPPANSSVTLSYECPIPIYDYTTGLHAYSPYDARPGSSRLTTKLYSFTPIESWAVNTFVYLDSKLKDPALPYYYGYGTKVYKIGGDFDRAYGTVVSYTVKKKLLGRAKTTTDTDGPRLFTGNTTNSSEACVIPLMEDLGLVKQIYNVTGLTQPQLYRYYMGYDPTNKRLSNDSVFTEYSLARSVHDPIVGSTHALKKITQGYITGYDSSLSMHLWIDALGLGGIGLLIAPNYITFGYDVANNLITLWDKLLGPFAEKITKLLAAKLLGLSLATWFNIIGWAYLAFAIFKIFFTYTTVKLIEPCKVFIHHFTNTPYINVGSVLYRTPTPSVRNTGFFCDGVYYYQQTGGATTATVTLKEVSCTNAVLTEDPLVYSLQCSLQADDPTLVTDKSKLIVLPYTSGKPLPYCGGSTIYYNTELSQVVTNTCCDLETCNSVTISVPAALEFSCISQADAQSKAQAKLNKAVNFAQIQGVYVTPFPDSSIGTLDSYFTHELRIENNPTEVTVYYDNRPPSTGAVVGKTLYFDASGCNKVLDGYYTITGTTPYRKFYHTTNGVIDAIYDMTASNSTNTTTGQPILTTNKDYSSNWYLTGVSTNAISTYANKIGNDRTFNPNSLYTSPAMKKGFIKTPTTKADFQLFTNFISTTYDEASPGAYQPLIDWIINDAFYYDRSRTISLDILESNYCNDSSTPKGFYVIGKYLGNEISTFYEVKLTIRLLTTNGALINTVQVVTSTSDPRTFVPYNTFVPSNTPVKNIEIVSIDSPNPQNKVTYTKGIVTMCAGNTCTLNAIISVVDTSNITADNGSATATASSGTAPYTYKWSSGYEQTTNGSSVHPSTLIADKQHYVVITDSTGCVKTFTFYVYNGTPDNFVADYIIFRYYWPYGDDLDTRTRMAIPDIGMNKVITPKKFCLSSWCYDSEADTDGYVGFKYPFNYPLISTSHSSTGHTNNILSWAGDNEDTLVGASSTFEEVLINVTKFKELYPSETGFTIDCRAFWYSTIVSNAAVQLTARAYKGGTVNLNIERNRNYFLVTSPTNQKAFVATPKEINARRNKTFFYDWRGPVRGERHSTFTYNLITGQGSFNSDDITTPAP
jgi:hypothetical protein